MNVTRADITPFLDSPIDPSRTTSVDAWLTAISAELTATLGLYADQDGQVPVDVRPAVFNVVADAIARRLTRFMADPRLRAQATGPSSVQYNTEVTALSGWFWPEEANRLYDLLSGQDGTVRSSRVPAPDGIRFGNLYGDEDDYEPGWYPL